MLSRVAESMFWMSRYMERAENVARFVMVNLNLSLDQPADGIDDWWPLVVTTGDDQDYLERYGDFSRDDVVRFLTCDERNRNSIISCLSAARENARGIRDMISTPMREHITKSYFFVRDFGNVQGLVESPLRFFSEVNVCGQQFGGIVDATLSRGEAWNFCQLGRHLERADKTVRLLDVKYLLLASNLVETAELATVTSQEEVQWLAMLRSAGALEMYRQRHGSITPAQVADMLVFDESVPRSVRFCVNRIKTSLHGISNTPMTAHENVAEIQVGRLESELIYSNVQKALSIGLHEYLGALLRRLEDVGEKVHESFFARIPSSPTKDPLRIHGASQNPRGLRGPSNQGV